MQIDFTERELGCLEKLLSKTLKASRKNLVQTKDESQKEIIRKTIKEKEVILKKVREIYPK